MIAGEEHYSFVSTEIHRRDLMFDGDLCAYLRVGQTAIESIEVAMRMRQPESHTINRVLDLDFACGHGRVCRHLCARFPQSEVVACDIRHDAVDFCASKFQAIPFYSTNDLADLSTDAPFDLIWVGSLYTHIDRRGWIEVTDLLRSWLNPQALLVFSVAGPYVYEMAVGGMFKDLCPKSIERVRVEYERDGFAYAPYSDTVVKPEDPPGWGRTFVRPTWVASFLTDFDDLDPVTHLDRGYGARQDVVACLKMR